MNDSSHSSIPRALAVVALSALISPWAAARPADPFAECEAGAAAAPEARESWNCFFETARRSAGWERATHRLDAYLAAHPENPWLNVYLGHVLLFQLSPRAEEHYRQAVQIFEGRGEAANEVDARIDLSRCLTRFNRGADAGIVLARAAEIAETVGDPILLAGVRIRQAFQLRHQGKDLDYAYHLLELAEEDVFPDGPESLKKQCLDAKALVSFALGRHDEFLRNKQRLLAMAEAAGDWTSEAEARFDIAVHHITTEVPSPSARRQGFELFEAALAAARQAAHPLVEAQARFELGRLVGRAEGRRHLEICLRIAADLGNAGMSWTSRCRGALAASLVDEDPSAAMELIDLALRASRGSDDLWATAYGSAERLYVHWETLPRSEAVADSLEVLDGLEALRDLQSSSSGRAGLMTLLSEVYYRLSGRLLEDGDSELAFTVFERLRARVLLEALEAAQAASPPPAAGPLVERLTAALKDQVRLNRLLLDPELQQRVRDHAIAELDSVESLVARLRHQIVEAAPSYGALRSPPLATLSQIEESLGEDEALLSFQLGLDEDFSGRFAGGAWLLVSTRDDTRVYRIPDRVALEPALDVLLGMADLDAVKPALARLHGDLLAPALADLPGVERLVIVPDGMFHRLPFALLRPSPDAEPLIARYQLSFAPSATLWRRWRESPPPASEAPVLALADPDVAGQTEGTADEAGVRQWAFEQSARLVRLPYARKEGEAVVRALGGDSRLLVAGEATERFLKETDLRRYGVLHFAAHAVIDDEVPERSAVMLAPGADDEDGWLQAQDIVGLDLDGRVVVLASCSGAGGQVLRGEGPMSLARAFFQAQAPVVVASLWPLPDDASARLFDRFYRRLARGAGVAQALAEAQREMVRQRVPARAWAGLVVLGNGDLVPFPGGLPGTGLPPWGIAVLVLAALGVLALVARRAGNLTPGPSPRGEGSKMSSVPLAAEHADRALAAAHSLAYPRYPGTEGDARAVAEVAGALGAAGLEVAVETFTYDVRPAFRALRAVLASCALLFAASTWLAPSAPGVALALIGLGLAAGGTLLVWAPWAERIYRREGPTKTANVVGRRPAAGAPRLTLVLLAHHDSKSQNLTFPVRMGATLLALAGGLTHAFTLAAAVARGAAPGPPWLVMASGVAAAAALAVLSTLRSGNASPGGVDNAGSVGLVLELARVLPPRIPDDVELVFLSPGAEEDHLIGAMRWLDAHLGELAGRPVWALNFDGAGSPGRLVLLTRYGLGRQFAPRLAALARRVAAELDIPVRNLMMPPAIGIDSIPFAHRGVECLSLSSGSLGRATMAIHSAGDVADHLDRDAMARALDLAVGVAEALCRSPAERPAPP